MNGFSEYFTFENMTKSSKYPHLVEQNRKEAMEFLENGKKLSFLCEEIRLFLCVPMVESSGFRGYTLSAEGGFSLTSAHSKFEALDCQPSGMSTEEAFMKIKKNANMFPTLRKVILEKINGKIWLHIEVKTKETDGLAFYVTTNGKNYTKV